MERRTLDSNRIDNSTNDRVKLFNSVRDDMEFVIYDIAKMAKEKGFREPCIAHYMNGMFAFNDENEFACFNKDEDCGCIDTPTISQLMNWIRRKHCYHSPINHDDRGWFYGDSKERYGAYEYACYAWIEYVFNELML